MPLFTITTMYFAIFQNNGYLDVFINGQRFINYSSSVSGGDTRYDLVIGPMKSKMIFVKFGPSFNLQKCFAVPKRATFEYNYSVSSIRREPTNRATR